MARPKNIAQWKEDPRHQGTLIAISEDARAALAAQAATHEAVGTAIDIQEAASARKPVTEPKTLGPGWVRIAVPTAVERAQAEAFRRMGFTEAEAELAAHGDQRERSINDSAAEFRRLVSLEG
jgi:hypothetical protein